MLSTAFGLVVAYCDGMATTAEDLGIDLDAVRTKYREERDKRIRTDGADQYIELSGEFAKFAETDPFATDASERDPITDDTTVVIIGGGFSGLLVSAG